MWLVGEQFQKIEVELGGEGRKEGGAEDTKEELVGHRTRRDTWALALTFHNWLGKLSLPFSLNLFLHYKVKNLD